VDADVSAIRARIEVVEHRLSALADRGLETAGLRSRLTQARDLLETGEPGDAQELTDEVAAGVRQLATGEARSSGEIRSLAREQLVGEVRQALVSGAAQEVLDQRMEAFRRDMETRLTGFERHLRDQFARELAQLVAAKPWNKDIHRQPSDEQTIRAQIRAVLAEEPPLASPAADQTPVIVGIDQLRDQVSGLRRRIESERNQGNAEERLQYALDAIASSEEGMTDLVAQIADLQAQLGDRVLALEHRLTTHARMEAAAGVPAQGPPATASTVLPLTQQTALHIEVTTEPAGAEHGVAATRRSERALVMPALASTQQGADIVPELGTDHHHAPTRSEGGGKAWPFGDESSLTAPAMAGADRAAAMAAATTDLPVAERNLPRSALTQGAKAIQAPPEGSSGLRMTPQPVTTDIRAATRLVPDEAVIRRLIEERLAAWRPVTDDSLLADDDDRLRELLRLLPQALVDGGVRTALFATIALESIERPGALAHLTQLRNFLRQELALAVEQMRDHAPA